MGFTSTTVKYILFFFNFFIAVCGAAIFGIALYIWKGDQSKFNNIIKEDITTPCIILAIAGAFVFIVAFLGCCGAIQESSCMMILYAVVLLAVLFIQAGVVGLAIMKKNSIEDAYKSELTRAFNAYPQNSETIDAMQQLLHCCGADGPQSYAIELPKSCYAPNTGEKYTKGCIKEFTTVIKDNLQTLMYVAIGVGIAEVVAIIFGLYYANHIRRYSNRGYA